MDLHTFNQSLERTGVIDTIPSLIWHRRFFSPGSFELTAPATPEYRAIVDLLQPYSLLVKPGAMESGYIHSIVIDDKPEQGETITATGSFLSGLLCNRTIRSEATTLAQLITQECIATDPARVIAHLEIGECENILIGSSVKGKNLGAVLEALARRDNFGYRVRFDIPTRKLLFETYWGVDHSEGQSVNPRVRFSQQYDNLLSSAYTWSDVGACDTVYCSITGLEGVQYTSLPEYHIEGNSGNNRIERTIDVSAVTYTVQVGESSVTKLDEIKTLAAMQAAAQEALSPVTENFEGEVAFGLGYKSEFDLGDVVTALHREWGKKTSQRITEVVEVYDNTSNSITPTFGNPAPTIMDILRKE